MNYRLKSSYSPQIGDVRGRRGRYYAGKGPAQLKEQGAQGLCQMWSGLTASAGDSKGVDLSPGEMSPQ